MIMNDDDTAALKGEEVSNTETSSEDDVNSDGESLDANPVANPALVQKLLDAAIKLHTTRKFAQAVDAYRKVLRADPNTAHAWINLGVLNRTMGNYEPAVVCLRRGLSIDPQNANAWSSLGNALRAINQLTEAKRAQEQGLSIAPELPVIHYNYALVLRDLGMLDLALKAFARAEALGYDKPELLWDRSLTYLTCANFKQGFAEYESRWDLRENPALHVDMPDWHGEDITDRTLLVYAEQGQGDSLQFVRYLPQLADKAKQIIFEAQPSIVSLFEGNSMYENITIIGRDKGVPAPTADFKVALLSLPICLGIEDDLFSAPMPYLAPPRQGLRMRKPKGRALRVGLTWTGKATHKNDRNRSIGLSAFSPLLDIAGVEFVSFQLGPAQKQIAEQGLGAVIRDLSPHLEDFSVTASFLQDVDLLISVDTSIIHLAGAMNVPTWALLAFTPDWRWQSGRADTPWYPNMTLFRQTSPNDWVELFHRVREALKKKITVIDN